MARSVIKKDERTYFILTGASRSVWYRITTVTFNEEWLARGAILSIDGEEIVHIYTRHSPNKNWDDSTITSIFKRDSETVRCGIEIESNTVLNVYIKPWYATVSYSVLSEGGEGNRYIFTAPLATTKTDADMYKII